MIELKNKILSLYRQVVGSIAFYPALIAALLLLLSVFVLLLEQYGATVFLEKHIHVLVIYGQETARTILSTLIGGLISLTVFSFSMVMILLSQASSYLSPRLLPGLISNKSHQFVLGCYLGTIVFCLLVLINIYKPDDDVRLPGFAILMAIVLGIFCLGLFVYFIHNISTAIQASNVLDKIFTDTRHHMWRMQQGEHRQLSLNDQFEMPETGIPVFSQTTGYLQEIEADTLMELAVEHDFVSCMKVTRGMFVLQNLPIATIDRELDKEALEVLLSCFHYSNRELVKENYVLGIKQITEVAVKAMSPGINDPGTAIIAIDFLTELFAIRLTISDYEWVADEEGKRRLFYHTISFKTLMFNVMASLRQYTKHDTVIVQKLLGMLGYLLSTKGLNEEYRAVLVEEKKALLADAMQHIENPHDRAAIEHMAKEG